MPSEAVEITEMLGEVRRGNTDAANKLMNAVYSSLKGIAWRSIGAHAVGIGMRRLNADNIWSYAV